MEMIAVPASCAEAAAGIELRKHIMSHTDTYVRGPLSAAEILAAIGEK